MFDLLKYDIKQWFLGLYDDSDQEFDEFYRKIEKARVKKASYMDMRKEMRMQKIKRKSEKYPLEVILSTGEHIIIPKQSKFKDAWLKEHGCSLMCEYIALQWLGVKKIKVDGKSVGIYPINLLKWHREHTKDQIKSKVTIKGVGRGINKLSDGWAVYSEKVTAEKIKDALNEGNIVIMEQKSPIHSILLLKDKDDVYIADHGKVEKADIDKIAKKATVNRTYRGMLEVTKCD